VNQFTGTPVEFCPKNVTQVANLPLFQVNNLGYIYRGDFNVTQVANLLLFQVNNLGYIYRGDFHDNSSH
jgi:hypothetical protein